MSIFQKLFRWLCIPLVRNSALKHSMGLLLQKHKEQPRHFFKCVKSYESTTINYCYFLMNHHYFEDGSYIILEISVCLPQHSMLLPRKQYFNNIRKFVTVEAKWLKTLLIHKYINYWAFFLLYGDCLFLITSLCNSKFGLETFPNIVEPTILYSYHIRKCHHLLGLSFALWGLVRCFCPIMDEFDLSFHAGINRQFI